MSNDLPNPASALQRELVRMLVAAAVRAPSGDNCQPWAFRIGPEEQLLIDMLPERAKSFFDFEHRATFLSVGAVVENMRTEAGFRGLGLRVDYPGGEAPGEAAAAVTPTAEAQRPIGALLHQAMLDRTVNRRPFRRRAPSAEQQEAVTTDPVADTQTRIFTERGDIKTWARLIYLADQIRISHPVIHEELFGKILLSREEVNSKRMGLEYDRLGIGPSASMVLKTLKPWARMQRLAKFGVGTGLAKQSGMMAASTGAMVLVSISEHSPQSWMRSGEQVERLWVKAQELGLCTHPMTVSLYLSQRYQEEGMKNFLPEHEPLLKEIVAGLAPLLDGRIGAMVFRLGSGWKMSGPAIRLPLEEFLPTAGQAGGVLVPAADTALECLTSA